MCGGKNTEKNSEFQMGHDLPYTSRMQKKLAQLLLLSKKHRPSSDRKMIYLLIFNNLFPTLRHSR